MTALSTLLGGLGAAYMQQSLGMEMAIAQREIYMAQQRLLMEMMVDVGGSCPVKPTRCSYCKSPKPNTRENCRNCGAPE